jgi:hypothetical protein
MILIIQLISGKTLPTPLKFNEESRRESSVGKPQHQRLFAIDDDIVAEFKQLVPQEQEYRQLINQALREWLIAKDVKELVRAELQKAVRQALSSVQDERALPKFKDMEAFSAEEKGVVA